MLRMHRPLHQFLAHQLMGVSRLCGAWAYPLGRRMRIAPTIAARTSRRTSSSIIPVGIEAVATRRSGHMCGGDRAGELQRWFWIDFIFGLVLVFMSCPIRVKHAALSLVEGKEDEEEEDRGRERMGCGGWMRGCCYQIRTPSGASRPP